MQVRFPRFGCVFHHGHPLTNFCNEPRCLLPLCSLCIKIHSEEHRQLGTHPSFEDINEVLQSTHGMLNQMISDCKDLSYVDSLRAELSRFVESVNLSINEHLAVKKAYLREAERMIDSLFSKRAMRTVIKMWPLQKNLSGRTVLTSPDLQALHSNIQSSIQIISQYNPDQRLLSEMSAINAEVGSTIDNGELKKPRNKRSGIELRSRERPYSNHNMEEKVQNDVAMDMRIPLTPQYYTSRPL